MNQYGGLGNGVERRDLHALRQDLGSAQDWMARICGPHELKAATPQRLRFQHAGNVMGGLATVLGRIEYGTDVTIDIEPCALNSYSISLPLEGQQALQTASGCLLSDSASGLIVSPQERQALAIDGNCRKIQVAIKASAMAAVLEDMLLQPLHEPLLFVPQISATEGAAGAWWRMVGYLLGELEQGAELFADGAVARDLERALIKGLILAQPNNYSAQLARLNQARCPQYVLRAQAFMHQHAREELNLETIERVAGVSRFTLYEGFKKHLGLSPTLYLKRYRLTAVRQALLAGQGEHNISAVAMDWGFNHLGRFSSDYKKLFQEMPSTTVERRRNAF
jgi:AraC-like DNA-binding protein